MGRSKFICNNNGNGMMTLFSGHHNQEVMLFHLVIGKSESVKAEKGMTKTNVKKESNLD
ncbi:hypothetical protein RvY_05088 [Ramazzottius varieornatus]|uniref:Uncharacterized protein n=1 Tax=Ramazzottius varieornatus TaxID=947166 RepID=A0A1D1UUF9_RAMVA|nr:hypothetical protein RvY_05088 [Ramazzottius varieornatus]